MLVVVVEVLVVVCKTMVKYPVAGGQGKSSLTNVPQSGGHRHHNYILISCDTWWASPPLSA